VRVLAVDLGSRRVGVAVSDPSHILASPHSVLDRRDYRDVVAALVTELEVERVVVGLPLSLSGDRGPAAVAAQAEADVLADLLAVPVETYDERLTTVTAARALHQRGVKSRAQRAVIDSAAAAVLLQAWLDKEQH
jgi:putative Holliday junction resolvase